MPIEIVCGNCENSFGVEAAWAGLIVECPFCRAAVQVPDEVASFADPPFDETAARTETPPEASRRAKIEPPPKPLKKAPNSKHSTKRPNRQSAKNVPLPEPDLADTQPVPLLESISAAPTIGMPVEDIPRPSIAPTTTPVPTIPVVAEPTTDPSLASANPASPDHRSFALPEWTAPPVCPGLVEANASADFRVTVRAGLTTINYHGQKMVLRDQPETVNWYGRATFGLSIVTLAVLLTWLYYVYR